MRIIKAAKKADELTDTCYQCNSILGVRESDLEWKDGNWSFICPVCQVRNFFVNQDKSELFPWLMEDEKDDNTVSDNHSMREYEV